MWRSGATATVAAAGILEGSAVTRWARPVIASASAAYVAGVSAQPPRACVTRDHSPSGGGSVDASAAPTKRASRRRDARRSTSDSPWSKSASVS